MQDSEIDKIVMGSARAITTVAPLLPHHDTIKDDVARVLKAAERGYLLPDEDEVVRNIFSRYLTTRAVLFSSLLDLAPLVRADLKLVKPQRPELFIVAFCTACLLVRSGRFLIDTFRKDNVIRKKLDEAEPRFGIPRKQFTKIYRSLTYPPNILTFLDGVNYWVTHREELMRFQGHPVIGPVLEVFVQEEEFIENSSTYYAMGYLKYRLHSLFRRHRSGYQSVMFALFKASGSVIAELRMKWKRKRVTPGVRRKIARVLIPGDVIITRHDDAASNLFLPGFWPHGALHIGTPESRRQLGIEMSDERWKTSDDPVRVLEARKDGVLFRQLDDTLNVDAFVVLRPRLSKEQLRDGVTRAITHEGKSYDFEFDFRRSDKLVCTEVVYRAYHGIGDIHFELTPRAGRFCLSAEDLLDHAVERRGFEVIAVYGCSGNRFCVGERALEVLLKSYRKHRLVKAISES